jgi:hypothetical protein
VGLQQGCNEVYVTDRAIRNGAGGGWDFDGIDERCPTAKEPELDDADVCMACVNTDSGLDSWSKERV